MRFVGDHAGSFQSWDCVIVGSHLPHCWVESGPCDVYVLHVDASLPKHVPGKLSGALLSELFTAAHCGLWYPPGVATEIVEMFSRMTATSAVTRLGLLLDLLGRLHEARVHDATTLSSEGLHYSQQPAGDRRVEDTVQWILDHYNEPVTIEQAMRRGLMSRATFTRQFKQHTGQSLTKFVSSVRLAAAYRELTTTTKPITDIAYESGFGSLSHFDATFRKRYGTTPRAVRTETQP